ncbi:hypothetical protein ACWC10_25445 [Streptomyces sp. NPDC001595]|uniref:hypothetical protein n=1 Tax=Streptomyces sp. NPDC001532 TaxID=3154520 RepID=UPI003329694D
MRMSSWAPGVALAVSVLTAVPVLSVMSVLSAGPARADAARNIDTPVEASVVMPVDMSVGLPVDVTASECVQGGGMIIIIADSAAPNGFSQYCEGGTHDGQTIT